MWDDWQEHKVFITSDKSKAEEYCKRFNQMLDKWKKYYRQFNGKLPEDYWIAEEYKHLIDRWHQITEANEATITEIEVR